MTLLRIQDYLQPLVERTGWREIGPGYEYLGIHRGVTVHVVEYAGRVTFLFHAPAVNLVEQQAQSFQGFRHWAAAGLPTGWIEGRPGDVHSCLLRANIARLGEIGHKRFQRLPDLIADDFQALGAPEQVTCQSCGKQPATIAALVNSAYTSLCATCWQQLRAQTPGDHPDGAVRLARVVPVWVIGSLLGLVAWGLLKQEKPNEVLLFVLPLVYGWVLGTAVRRTRTRVNLALGAALFASVVVVLWAGNVWGFRASLGAPKEPPAWAEVWQEYFTVQLRQHLDEELPYLVGGVLGLWLGLAWLQPLERSRVR
jgi:hypothetical protein